MTQTQFTIDFLMKSTPLIRKDYEYKREITNQERIDMSVDIADATIEIERRSAQIKELQEEAKAYAQERKTKADILDSQFITDFAKEAVMFFDTTTGTITVYIEKDGEMRPVITREAFSTEIAEWRQKQEEIRQTVIENDLYRQQLVELAERSN